MTVPTLSELYISVQSDLRNRLNITTVIGKVGINALAIVQAAKLKLFYLRSIRTYENIFYDQCDDETIVRFGRILLKRDPFPASAGVYTIQVTGIIGATIAAGTTFKSRDTSANPGKLYILDTLFTFVSTTGLIDVRALEVGLESTLNVADEVKSTQPLADVESIATVMTVITEPLASEDIGDYREKVILAAGIEPQGGARVDFRLWSLDAQGVRTSYPYVKSGYPSQVELYVEAIPTVAEPNGEPTATILAATEDVIELDPDTTLAIEDRGRRPMWAVLSVADGNIKSIIPLPVDVEITNLSDVSLLPSITESLRSFLYNIRPYLAGADNATESQKGKLYAADISAVVRDTIGTSTFDDIELQVDSNVITSFYEFLDGKIPYINNVTNV